MQNTRLFTYIRCFLILWILSSVAGFAQESSVNSEVVVLESRFSTTTPIVGDSLKYSLKFDHLPAIQVQPVEYFTENGMTVLERKQLQPQTFQGRVIEQYEYTLHADRAGEYHISPITIEYVGPRQNPVAAVVEPVQLNILPVIEIQVMTNSPIMLGEPLELSLAVIKRKPATISALPHELEAALQASAEPTPDPSQANSGLTGKPTPGPSQEGKAEPTPGPSQADSGLTGKTEVALRFTLDESQTITPQPQQDGSTVEQYNFLLAAPPERAGEYILPAFEITYRTPTGEEQSIQAASTSIFVLNPNTPNLAIETDYRYLIAPAIILGALLLGSLAVFLFLKYRKPRTQTMVVYEPLLSPGEVAHKELAEIQARQLPAKGEFKTYYFLLSETVRKFLGAEFHFPVLERTTEEILRDIHHRDLPEAIKRRISIFLPEADIVKFAKYIPSFQEADEAMTQARLIVDDSLACHQLQETQEPESAMTV
ncbi:hypothetical protein U27_04232 [Candidatus Vecturithrix granuli]|uniref:Protein BatD n=1 Tax=Vecturithrix granuli TaxID=1499967 RepID=A0A081BY62_VECG1|nr:hypothetical protein U27_04232 [Candidatus Vecturithrix granuli]